MRAFAIEFRYRYLIHTVIFVLGFWAPWERVGRAPNTGQSTWLTLASLTSRSLGWSFSGMTIALLVLGTLLAAAAALLRTWGAAYLGAAIVKDGEMHAKGIVAGGPYRYMRNPLYVGTWIHTLALALLMPPTGALFAIVAIAFVQVRLIGGEEAFLTSSLGQTYAAYAALVPQMLPAFRARVAASEIGPRWAQAVLGEFYMWGVAVSFAVFGWRYNAFLLTQSVVVSFGLSLVARALIPAIPENASEKKPATVAGD